MAIGKGEIYIFNGFSNKQKQTGDQHQCVFVPLLSCLVSSQSTVCKKPLGDTLFNKTSKSDIDTFFWEGSFLYAAPSCDPRILLAFHFSLYTVFLQFLFLPLKCYKILCLIMPSFSKIKMRTQSGKCKRSYRTWVVASSGSRGPGGVRVQEIYLGHNSKDKGEERGQEQVGRAFS